MTWHIATDALDQYSAASLDDTTSASVEAHLVACGQCRQALTSRVALPTATRLDAVWADVVDVLDTPAPRPVERLLIRLGVAEDVSRLLAATPALHASWLGAVLAVLAFAVAAAHAAPRGFIAFVTLAPLVPLAGIATAYGPGVDPTYEIGLAAPMHAFRLLLLRASAVLATSIALAGGAALALPAVGSVTVTWLLPALALSLASLALAGVVNPLWASAGLGLGWVTAVVAMHSGAMSRGVLHSGPAQTTWGLLAMAALVIMVARRDRYDASVEQES